MIWKPKVAEVNIWNDSNDLFAEPLWAGTQLHVESDVADYDYERMGVSRPLYWTLLPGSCQGRRLSQLGISTFHRPFMNIWSHICSPRGGPGYDVAFWDAADATKS